MTRSWQTLDGGLRAAFASHGGNVALDVDGDEVTYAALAADAGGIAHAILETAGPEAPFVAVLASRSRGAYAGAVGVLLAGRAYLPLNPRFPIDRLAAMLEAASCDLVVASDECADELRALVERAPHLAVISAGAGRDTHAAVEGAPFPKVSPGPDDPAYLLFTSGSTGAPKGVAVSHGNVCSYLAYTIDRYDVSPDDRLSQMFDLTFDLSVHDIFVSLLAGARLCVVPQSSVMGPAKFIRDKGLTLWFSVPSAAMFMERMKMLKPDAFPSLRFSLFCGEALPQRTAEAWQGAAPNSIVENLYGPTEATIAITNYPWDPVTSPDLCVNGVVPIGRPFEGSAVRIVDAAGEAVAVGDVGELCLGGPQVTRGYLGAPDKTAQKYVRFAATGDTLWYRTGDLATQDEHGCLFYMGRTDDQIQLRGFRVELQEIDRVIREAAGTDLAVSVPIGLADGRADGVWACVEGEDGPTSEAVGRAVMDACAERLPDYMRPARVRFIPALPLNLNGKIDRNALAGDADRAAD